MVRPVINTQLALVCLLTFIIHLISTLSYALRIAGIRTGRIAVSFALANILLLVSRTSNTFQGPLLANHVERNILQGSSQNIEADFRWLLLSATLATIAGALLIPTFRRLFTVAIEVFGRYRSIPRLLLAGLSVRGLKRAKASARVPSEMNLARLSLRGIPLVESIYSEAIGRERSSRVSAMASAMGRPV